MSDLLKHQEIDHLPPSSRYKQGTSAATSEELSKLENIQRTLWHDAPPHRSTASGATSHLSGPRDRMSE
jgi:hypothetical protein